MPRKRTRKKHTAKASIQVLSLSKAGTSIDLEIYRDKEKLGTLVIGRGSLTWYGNKWKYGRKFSWPAFASLMED
jgi:hypothetical protein